VQQVGVMAVVEGLSSFIGDIGKMNSAMDSLKPQGNMLTSLFAGVGNAISSFGQSVARVAEIALGVLLRDAINAVIGKIKELVSATIEAGAEFQTLSLRLNRLNLNDALETTSDFTEATNLSIKATKEQLSWLQKLAVQTPYDAQDIANTFTLARSYGFASEAAKGLTEDISNFAAGMGLGGVEIKRIIVNMGQMVQQGKVTQREMNDLARGAFVPVNDVLKIMQEETGLTGAAFDKFRNSGEGVQSFLKAFSSLVDTRFTGAAQAMARTFSGASANAQDFVKSLIGFNVVAPVLDVVGGKIADFVSALTEEGNWELLNKNAAVFGNILSGLVGDLLGGVDPGTFVDKLVEGFQRAGSWILENRDKIIGFFEGIKEAIQTKVIPFIQRMVDKLFELRDWFVTNRPAIEAFFKNIGMFIQTKVIPFVMKLVDAFMMLVDWVQSHGPLLQTFFEALGNIIGTVFENLTGIDFGGGTQDFIQLIEKFLLYVIENQDAIAEFITNLLKLSAVFTVIGFVLGIIVALFTAIFTAVMSVVMAIAGLISIVVVMASGIGIGIMIVIAFLILLMGHFTEIKSAVVTWWTDMKTAFVDGANALGETFIQMWEGLISTTTTFVGELVNTFTSIDWEGTGADIIGGIADGISGALAGLMSVVESAAQDIANAFANVLGIESPSKVFKEFGKFTMEGLAEGVAENAKIAEAAMMSAVGQIVTPALNMPAITQQYATATGPSVNNQNSYTNNYNLTVNSSAPTEPIIQDYNMLQSISGI